MPPKKPPARPRKSQPTANQNEQKNEEQQASNGTNTETVKEQQNATTASAENGPSTSTSAPEANGQETTQPASTSNAGSSSRGRGNAARASTRPRGIGRRSVQGRAELERVEAERKKVEAASQLKSSIRARRDGGRARGTGPRRRGGYAGETERGAESIVSGPFSLGEVRKAEGRRSYAGAGRALGGGGSSSGGRGDGIASSSSTHQSGSHSGSRSGGTHIKQEGGSNNDIAMTDVYLKQEDGGSISSDAEDEDTGRRKLNIDDPIDLTIDEDEDDSTYLLPVRIQRVEHRERALLANAESTKPNESASAVAARSEQAQSQSPDRRRAKQRVKDVEITGSNHRYKGTYSDSSEDEVVEIKTEPADPTTSVSDIAPQTRTVSPEARRAGKGKARTESHSQEVKKPHFHTAEEEVEWTVRERDLRILRAELGVLSTGAENSNSTQQEDSNPRDDKVYLFQMPAVLPALKTVVPKVENEDVEMQGVPEHRSNQASKPASTSVRDAGGIVKKRSDLPPGLVGKLKVHASGRAFLDWGGIPLEVSMGQEASFLQDVLLMDKVESKPHSAESDTSKEGGSVMSMGQVKGKFVIVPDWDKVFEQAA